MPGIGGIVGPFRGEVMATPPRIAMAASLLLCAQNFGAVTAFGWAMTHGADVPALIAFVPAAVGLAMLRAAYGVFSGPFEFKCSACGREANVALRAHPRVLLPESGRSLA